MNIDSVNSSSSTSIAEQAQAKIDQKTKPPGSLGEIESLAVQLASVQQSLTPSIDPARIIVFAADHGISAEGVSAYPAEVTAQMMSNFDAGGAVICALSECSGASLEVVDVGVKGDLTQLKKIVHSKIAQGTANYMGQAAMSHEQLDASLQAGREAIVRAVSDGVRCVGLGEMGIGNTTSAAILTGLMCGADANAVTGRGTGIDDAQIMQKQRVVESVMQRLHQHSDDPLECLRQAGGFEIAALVGAMMEAPAHKLAVIVDGFIVTAAALIACKQRPAVRDVLFFSHRSAELGHEMALEELQATPLLQLGMRLGEGSASAMAVPLLRAATAVLCKVASFNDAGVSTASADLS